MKNIIMPLVFLLLFMPFTVKAHTALTSSNPEAGQVLDKQPEQIELSFGTVIEEGSSLTLQGPEGTLEMGSLSISGNRMAASLNNELEDGDYVIAWKIIGADGHPIEGEVPFSLKLAATEEITEEPIEEPVVEEPATDQEKETDEAEKPAETSTPSAETESGSGLLTIGLIILLIVLAAVVIRLLIKRKQ